MMSFAASTRSGNSAGRRRSTAWRRRSEREFAKGKLCSAFASTALIARTQSLPLILHRLYIIPPEHYGRKSACTVPPETVNLKYSMLRFEAGRVLIRRALIPGANTQKRARTQAHTQARTHTRTHTSTQRSRQPRPARALSFRISAPAIRRGS
jgi:hypothetical protein